VPFLPGISVFVMDTRNASLSPPADLVEYQRWLDGIVRLSEGAELRGGVHPDTLKRDAKKKGHLLKLGKRAIGIRRRHALMLG
jgi:hypothetical protein